MYLILEILQLRPHRWLLERECTNIF